MTMSFHPPARALLGLGLLALATGCDGGTTTPESDVQLSSTSATSLEMIAVSGLLPVPQAAIRVGGMDATLVYDPVAQVHRFLVPMAVQGTSVVEIPAAATGDEAVELRLSVSQPVLVGGTTDAAVATLDQLLGTMKADAQRALDSLGSGEAALVALAASLEQSATALQELLPNLGTEERQLMASLYSSNRAHFDAVARALATSGSTRAPTFARATAATDGGPLPTAEALATQCIDANLRFEWATDILDAASYFHLALPSIALLTTLNVQVAKGVAMMTGAFVTGIHAAIQVQGTKPRFFHPEGLRIEPVPPRVRENGGTGEMRAWLRMVGAVEAGVAPDDFDLGETGMEWYERYQELGKVRRLTPWDALRTVLLNLVGDASAVEVLDRTRRVLDAIYEEGPPEPAREIRIALDGLDIQDINNSGLWQFTSPPTGASRTFSTVGQIRRELGYEIVALASTAGRGEACRARTPAADPQSGRNGFIVTGPPILRSATHELESLNSCTTPWGTGSLFRIRAEYFAANTLGPGSRVDAAWSFVPSGSAGSFTVQNTSNTELGTQGHFAFHYCATFNEDEATSVRFTATDPEGLTSNALSVSFGKPAGASSIAPVPRKSGASGTLVPDP